MQISIDQILLQKEQKTVRMGIDQIAHVHDSLQGNLESLTPGASFAD